MADKATEKIRMVGGPLDGRIVKVPTGSVSRESVDMQGEDVPDAIEMPPMHLLFTRKAKITVEIPTSQPILYKDSEVYPFYDLCIPAVRRHGHEDHCYVYRGTFLQKTKPEGTFEVYTFQEAQCLV